MHKYCIIEKKIKIYRLSTINFQYKNKMDKYHQFTKRVTGGNDQILA
jgi:hypothetical protein